MRCGRRSCGCWTRAGTRRPTCPPHYAATSSAMTWPQSAPGPASSTGDSEMTADNSVDALRARLSGLSGADRIRPLLELGRLLADRYWRAGPGSTASRPHLDAAVAAIQEAYDSLDPTDQRRGPVAGNLGWLLAARSTAHGGADSDREAGIRLLNEALSFPDLPPSMRRIGRLCLGQLYLQRCTAAIQGPALATAMQSGVAPDGGIDADRAVA